MEIPAVNQVTITLALPLPCLTLTAGIDDIHDLPFREAIPPGYSHVVSILLNCGLCAPFASAKKRNVAVRDRLIPRYFLCGGKTLRLVY